MGRLRNVTGPQPTYHACMGAPVALLQNLHFWSAGSDANCDLAFSLDLRFGAQVILARSPQESKAIPHRMGCRKMDMCHCFRPQIGPSDQNPFLASLHVCLPPVYLKSSLPADLQIPSIFTLTCNREAEDDYWSDGLAWDEQEGCCCYVHPNHPTRSDFRQSYDVFIKTGHSVLLCTVNRL